MSPSRFDQITTQYGEVVFNFSGIAIGIIWQPFPHQHNGGPQWRVKTIDLDVINHTNLFHDRETCLAWLVAQITVDETKKLTVKPGE